jgi:hypothetical protein
MPRGVPANGRRQSRFNPGAARDVETTDAVSTEDAPDRESWTAVDQEPALPEQPADIVVELPASASDVELTPEQAEIQRLRDLLARETGRKDVDVPVSELTRPGDDKNILIHVLEDGFTALGKVWYRGEELEFEPGGRAYKDTFNKRGQTWLDLRNDEFGQAERWGKIMFRNGPWPGKSYADGTYEVLRSIAETGHVPPPSQAEIEAAEKARKKRAAPHLPAGI